MMPSANMASDLEKGHQELSPVPDSSFGDKLTGSTDTGTTLNEKASYFPWCTY